MDNLKKPRRVEDEDVEIIQIGSKDDNMIRSTKQEVYSHQVSLDENIGPPVKYRELINALYMAGEHDQFNIFVNNGGGYLSTACAIIEAIRACSGTVRAIITGECHSAASMIALNCHEIMVTDSATMMVHTASYGTGGNTHNVKAHTEFSTKQINKILDRTYEGFLSPVELVELKKGCEMWFDSVEIEKRLNHRVKFLAAKNKPKTVKPKVAKPAAKVAKADPSE